MDEPMPFTASLSKASRKTHDISNSLVNAKLIALFSDRELYAKALGCFYYVFVALEGALDEALKRGDSELQMFKEPLAGGLYRAPGYKEDMVYFLGPDWQARCGPKSKAVKDYEAHLAALGSKHPALLLAHVYTQHLAMASGGQIIKRWARKIFELPEDKGTGSFDFKGESNNTLRSQFKSKLDEWARGIKEEERQQLLSEHLAAFQHNNAIIRAFPVPPVAIAKGVLRVTPRPILLGLLGVLGLIFALILTWLMQRLR